MKRSWMWPLAQPHSGGTIRGACRRWGAPDAMARRWHPSIKSPSPPVGRYLEAIQSLLPAEISDVAANGEANPDVGEQERQ